jgi:hypothetical protein
MRSHARSSLAVFAAAIYIIPCAWAGAQVVTPCSNGSTITCQTGSFSWCKVSKKGIVDGGCADLPDNASGADLLASVLSSVLPGEAVSTDNLERYSGIFDTWETSDKVIAGVWKSSNDTITIRIWGRSAKAVAEELRKLRH